ncbi:MAG: hypothetical protein ACE3L7_05660 [Candidatus Pristimantibacillus sp.]
MRENDHILDLRAKMPPHLEGNRFIKSITIGLPFVRMKLNITTRREYHVPLAHEAVLRLIEEKWNSYDQIREILGIDQDYFDNILLELGESDYITHLGRKLALSDIGRKLLTELKSIRIEPDFMENVHVNMLTGEIIKEESEYFFKYRERAKCEVYLNNKIDLSGNFLVNHEQEIRELYNVRIGEDRSKSMSDDTVGEDELYRVINIEDYIVVYEELLAHVYYSNETQRLNYYLANEDDVENELHYSCLKDQLRDHPKSFDGVYSTLMYKKHKDSNLFNWYSGEEYSLPALQHKREELALFLSNTDIQLEQISSRYYTDRLLMYREYQEILKALTTKTPYELVIITDQFYDLQNSEYNLLTLIESLSQKTKIYIGHSSSSRTVISKIKQKNVKEVRFKEFLDIRGTRILINNEYMIAIHLEPFRVGSEYIIDEIGILTYDQEQISIVKDLFQELFPAPVTEKT